MSPTAQTLTAILYSGYCTIVQATTITVFGINVMLSVLPIPVIIFMLFPKQSKLPLVYFVTWLIAFIHYFSYYLSLFLEHLKK